MEARQGCNCRVCQIIRSRTDLPFGAPFVCPKCRDAGSYHGILKVPGSALPVCSDCGTKMVSLRKRER